MLSVISIVLALTWSLSAAGNVGHVGNPNNHIARIHAEQTAANDADIVPGPYVRPARASMPYNRDTADTMAYVPADGGWNGQFIQSPGDAMWTVFTMPADGTLKGVNVPIYEWGTGDQQMMVSLHKMQFPNGADGTPYSTSQVDGAGWIGGYDMDANGWVAIEGTTYTPAGTAGICEPTVSVGANAADPLLASEPGSGPAGYPVAGLIWPDGFTAATLDPTNNPDVVNGGGDNWINLADFGSEPDLLAGDVVGVLVQSTGAGGGDDPSTGFYYESGSGVVDPWVSGKFYGECGGTSGNGGWHIRHWMFDFELAVLLTGDRGPSIYGWSELPTTLSTAARAVDVNISDDNPSGGAAGVASATLFYQVDSLTAPVNEVALTMTAGTAEDGTWSGELPGQEPGTFVYWWVECVDVGGLPASPAMTAQSYFIFLATPGNDLIFNNQDALYGEIAYSSYLYFYWGGQPFDIWDASYGGITAELVDNYSVIVEEAGTGPFFDTDDILSAWWTTGNTLLVSGDEWLGARYGWTTPITVPAGDLAHDVMGIDTYNADINYYASGDDAAASRLTVNADDVIVGPLAAFLADSLELNYNPDYETGGPNWLDGVTPLAGFNAAMSGFEGPLADAGDPDPATTEYTTMIWGGSYHAGGTAFLGFDAIALNTVPSYYWVGAHDYSGLSLSPLGLAYEYFAGPSGVGDDNALPSTFELKGNYPNPFNPSTHIAFSLGSTENVSVKVFSLLGEEIATLHSGVLNSGVNEVTWNGVDQFGKAMSSGIYLYRVEAGNKSLTGKMMLIK